MLDLKTQYLITFYDKILLILLVLASFRYYWFLIKKSWHIHVTQLAFAKARHRFVSTINSGQSISTFLDVIWLDSIGDWVWVHFGISFNYSFSVSVSFRHGVIDSNFNLGESISKYVFYSVLILLLINQVEVMTTTIVKYSYETNR